LHELCERAFSIWTASYLLVLLENDESAQHKNFEVVHNCFGSLYLMIINVHTCKVSCTHAAIQFTAKASLLAPAQDLS
jgi:hypothetical protein